jgi:DNA-directed RNA polymerase specialized sigma24 family protein
MTTTGEDVKASFNQFVREHDRRAREYVRHRVRDHHVAEDITQAVLLGLWKAWETEGGTIQKSTSQWWVYLKEALRKRCATYFMRDKPRRKMFTHDLDSVAPMGANDARGRNDAWNHGTRVSEYFQLYVMRLTKLEGRLIDLWYAGNSPRAIERLLRLEGDHSTTLYEIRKILDTLATRVNARLI